LGGGRACEHRGGRDDCEGYERDVGADAEEQCCGRAGLMCSLVELGRDHLLPARACVSRFALAIDECISLCVADHIIFGMERIRKLEDGRREGVRNM
jgi:hypothetical protein